MKHITFLSAFLFVSPVVAFGAPRTIQEFGNSFIEFLNNTLMGFLFALALLVFIYNVIRYFIIKVNSSDGQEQAKKYLIWSIIGFVLIVTLWGIVNMLVGGLGLRRELPICPDYLSDEACRSFQNSSYDSTSPSSQTNLSGVYDGGSYISPSQSTDSAADSYAENFGSTDLDTYEDELTAVVAELEGNIDDVGFRETQIGILSDPNISDNLKITTVETLHEYGDVSTITARSYVQAINDERTVNGETYIFSDLLQ